MSDSNKAVGSESPLSEAQECVKITEAIIAPTRVIQILVDILKACFNGANVIKNPSLHKIECWTDDPNNEHSSVMPMPL